MKTQKDGIGASGLVNTRRGGENGAPGESIGAPCLFPIPCPVLRFHLAAPELYPFIINCLLVSKMFL